MPNIGAPELIIIGILVIPAVVVWMVSRRNSQVPGQSVQAVPGSWVASPTPPPAEALVTPFRSSNTRSRWAMVLVGITSIVLLFQAMVILRGLSLFDDLANATTLEADEWARTLAGLDSFYLLAIIASAVAVLAWLSRAVENVPALGGGMPLHSPRGAIGWWFVPIANLFVPYQIVADLWRRMGAGTGGVSLVVAWWVLWIVGNLGGRVLGSAGASVKSVHDFRVLLMFDAAALAVNVVAGALLMRIIWEIEQRVLMRNAATGTTAVVLTMPAAATPATRGEVAQATPTSGEKGTPAQPIVAFCPSCGAARIPQARFCAGCGRDLEALPRST